MNVMSFEKASLLRFCDAAAVEHENKAERTIHARCRYCLFIIGVGSLIMHSWAEDSNVQREIQQEQWAGCGAMLRRMNMVSEVRAFHLAEL